MNTTTKIDPEAKLVQIKAESDLFKIMCPARILISGPTLCGKSEMIFKLVKHRDELFSSKFERLSANAAYKYTLIFLLGGKEYLCINT